MSETLPVVTVKGQGGDPLRINQSDYDADPSAWELLTDETTVAVAPAAITPTVPETPSLAGASVAKMGTGKAARFYVVDAEGEKIAGVDGIDADGGYESDGAAWAAIMAVTAKTA